MSKHILCILLLTFTIFPYGDANSDKVIVLKKIDTEILIDGEIDDIWMQADSAVIEFQLTPYYGEQPTYKAVSRVLTTEKYLYCLIVCYDDPNNIESITGVHDNGNGDLVSMMIDTFNDDRTAYRFAVTASGVKIDYRLLDDARNRDRKWDGIWFAESKRYDWGYAVEMKIPYKTLKFDKALKAWGIDFDRWKPTTHEDLYWCTYDREEGMRISKFGRLQFEEFSPSESGLNLEIYPVGITKATYKGEDVYDIDPNAGLDIFYNPSPELTFQLTANPDFAQIEADPYDFNISRYESYFDERRPFFTEGNEVFTPSGRSNNTGFYRPIELFYSRRIGKKLPDGQEVPLLFGTKAHGRSDLWEYGGFLAMTGEREFLNEDDEHQIEEQAYFGAARVSRQVLGNSSIGVLFVGKQTANNTDGVIDIDGAFRGSNWQLAYQVARSIHNDEGDFAGSAGYISFHKDYLLFARTRIIGSEFDISEIGYVPWQGTAQVSTLYGPRWYYDEGYLRQLLIYGGLGGTYENDDLYTDTFGFLGLNMQFRDNWGYELNVSVGNSIDDEVEYTSYNASLNSWMNISPKWHLWYNIGYEKSYNFSREYLSFYSWANTEFSYNIADELELGTQVNIWVEGNEHYDIADITYNTRPYLSVTPVNDLNMKLYVDNVFMRSSDQFERFIVGFLFSWNFSPKSWVYFAYNEIQERPELEDGMSRTMHRPFRVQDRASVLKIKYLYYF